MKKKKVLQMAITKLGFNHRRLVAITIDLGRKINGTAFYGELHRGIINDIAIRFKVADIISVYDRPIRVGKDSRWLLEFYDKALEFGLTKLDWLALPYETARKEFRYCNKEELKNKSILLLEPSKMLIEALKFHFEPAVNLLDEAELNLPDELDFDDDHMVDEYEIPISYLLNMSVNILKHHHDFERSIFNLCQKLLEMGFQYEDGIFLQEGTRREFVERLMREEGLSKRSAGKFADLAHERGYIGNSLKWDLIR